MATFQNHDDHLFVEISGPYSLEYFLECVENVAVRCREASLSKVLVDLRGVTGHPSIMDRYRIGVALADSWGSGIQGAMIAPRSMVNRMTETVVFNRGGRIRVFFDRPEAVAWLGVSG